MRWMMQRIVFAAIVLLFSAMMSACATSPDTVEVTAPEAQVPERAEGEAAVFGKVRVVENILGYHEIENQDSAMYPEDASRGGSYKVKCDDDGSFGVYLPPGVYRIKLVNADEYRFIPFAGFTVPEGTEALYVGTIEFDGTPTGIYKGEYDWFADTKFIYSIKDESEDFMAGLRMYTPDAGDRVTVKLMTSEGAIAIGNYEDKVFRSQDVVGGMAARRDAVEHIVGGAIMSLPYIINPVWLFTLH